ncbi:MAG: NUDIX domain-containing protein [Candidatus Aenigmarchaeota archaeon]|nr:NUDIX domain-containing protein [Candidatus Aenigmarchaeota archaeon]
MDELVDITDENSNETGVVKKKSLVHRDGDWHKGIHVWIVKDDKILLQKRAPGKKLFPNKLDVSCAGHVMHGESCEDTAVRELEEELGISVKPSDLLLVEKRKQISFGKEMRSREINAIFLLFMKSDLKDLKLQKSEVSEVKLFAPDELRQLFKNKPQLFVDDKKYLSEMIDKIEGIMKK